MNLWDGLTKIRERLNSHRELYETNEMAVRDQLINPTLRLLGWDTEDPEKVQPNVSTEEGVPDYILLKNGQRRLLLEAKKLSVDVEDGQVMGQLARYSFGQGTTYGLITNGTVWLLVRSFEENTTIRERVVWRTDLENESQVDIERKLQTASWENVDQIDHLVRKLLALDRVWTSVLEDAEAVARALIPVVRTSMTEAYPNLEFQEDEIRSFLRERVGDVEASASHRDQTGVAEEDTPTTDESAVTGATLRRMRIGTEAHELRHSFEILVNVGNWLVREQKLTAAQCPVPIGRKRNIVHTEPKHRYGDDFLAPKKLVNGLWIETHYSTAAAIRSARHLLERFSVQGDALSLESDSQC
jgi:hypothetical protein